MIDQDKMRALAERLRDEYEARISITSSRYRDAISKVPLQAANAIDLLLAEVEAANRELELSKLRVMGSSAAVESITKLVEKLRAELEAAAADKRDAERYRYLRSRMRFTDQLPVATMMLSAPLFAPLHNFHTDWVGDRFDVSVDKTVDAARTGERRD